VQRVTLTRWLRGEGTFSCNRHRRWTCGLRIREADGIKINNMLLLNIISCFLIRNILLERICRLQWKSNTAHIILANITHWLVVKAHSHRTRRDTTRRDAIESDATRRDWTRRDQSHWGRRDATQLTIFCIF
jgi:hypothetical protein